jgi:hypothetical protein
VRATSYDALGQLDSGNYFTAKATHRLVVLLTDGESNPVNSDELARSLRGYRVVAVRFWKAGESVYGRGGKPEADYRPDPSGRIVLDGVASALGGRVFDESSLGDAAGALQRAAGTGPTTSTSAGSPGRTPLAPYLAALAILLLLAALLPRQLARLRIQSAVP